MSLNIITLISILLIKISSYMIGVDLGSEFFKVTVIKPGKPFMMMENLQAKTKTPNVIGLKDNEITFDNEALAKKARIPQNIFTFFSEYLGRTYDNDFVQNYLKDFFVAYNISSNNESNSIEFNLKFNNKDEKLSIEELYAMLFNHIKFLSEKFAKIEIVDLFLTIPSNFDYHQRQAISQAVEISKLNLMGIVTENIAAAVQFQLKKNFENETFYIIYNMGSTTTDVSLISYKTLYNIKDNKTIDLGNQIKIYGEYCNEKLGGKYFDKNLIEFIMKKFDELPQRQGKESIKLNKNINKIFEKIRPSAIKYKEILSANKEAYIAIIGLDSGIDLQSKITRDEFNEINSDLIKQIYYPIEYLLNKSNITLNQIEQIELIGGGIRVPIIQEELKNNLNNYSNLLGTHMNGDDTMAFGAAYMAANASQHFRGSRKTFIENGAYEIFRIYLSNLVNENQSINYCNDNENNEKVLFEHCVHLLNKNSTLFPLRYKYDSVRNVNFNHDSNILVKITEEFPDYFEERDLINFEVTGMENVIKEMKNDNVTKEPKVNLKFKYSKGGQITLKAFASYNVYKYFNQYFLYTKNKSEPLSEEELTEINEMLNKSKVISKQEMKKMYKNYTESLKNETNQTNLNNTESNNTETNKNETHFDTNNTNENNNETNKNDTNNDDPIKDAINRQIKKPKLIIPNNFTFNDTLYITTELKETLLKKKRIGEKKEFTEEIDLNVKEIYTSLPKPLTKKQIREGKEKLKHFEEVDLNRTKLIERKNTFESLLYSQKEWIENPMAKNFSLEKELEESIEFLNNKSLWYEDEGYSASYEILDKEIRNITNHFSKYEKRIKIVVDRNEAIKKFEKELNSTFIKIGKLLKDKPWTSDYYNNTFLKDYNSVLNWLNESIRNQSQISLAEKPILTAAKINSKGDLIRRSYYRMTQIKKPQEEKDKEKVKKPDNLFGNDFNYEELIKKYNISKEELEKIQKEVQDEMKKNLTNTTNANENNNNTNDKSVNETINDHTKSDL